MPRLACVFGIPTAPRDRRPMFRLVERGSRIGKLKTHGCHHDGPSSRSDLGGPRRRARNPPRLARHSDHPAARRGRVVQGEATALEKPHPGLPVAQQHHRVVLNVLDDDALYQGASVANPAGPGLDINQPETRRGLVRVPTFGAHDRDGMLIDLEDRPTCSHLFEQIGIRQVVGRFVVEFGGSAREQIGELRM